MNLSDKLLKSKVLTPIQKLILGLIMNESEIVLTLGGGYHKTCGEMGAELGLSRLKIKLELEKLIELGYLTSEKGRGWRKTNLTAKCNEFIE